MTTVNLLADGTIPRVAIWTGDDDLPWSDPETYAARVRFHSDWDYLEAFYSHSMTIDMPATPGSRYVQHDLPAHGYAGIPFMLVQVNSRMLPPQSWLQFDPTKQYLRALYPSVNEINPILYEYGSSNHFSFNLTGSTIPAFTANVVVTLLRPVTANPAGGIDIDPTNGVVKLGGFEASSYKRVRVADTATFGSLAKIGPTIDFVDDVGMRIVEPDGTTSDLGSYSGSFAGSGGWPLVGI